MQDDKLLTQYARDGSEAAFSQLISRHLTLVYRTCQREIGSAAQAEDAAQVVFLLLARKAKTLRTGSSLAGWLYNTSRFVAKDVRKQEARRKLQEQTVMQEIIQEQTTPSPEWDTIEPLLNEALSSLKPADREAVLLRFLEGHTLAETGTLLGLTEDAARMRVTRAVEKLRVYLTTHGAAVTGVILAALLTTEAVRPLPANSVAAITQGTLQALSTGPASNVLLLSKGVSHTMKIIKVKYAILTAAVLLAGASVPPLVHALNQRQTIRQVAVPTSLSPTRRQAFQLGLILRSSDLQAQDYNEQVSNISNLLDQPIVVMAEIEQASQNIPKMREEQAAYYQRAAATLGQIGAPTNIQQWYLKVSVQLSKPLFYSQATKVEARAKYAAIQFSPQSPADARFGTEAQVTTDLAEMAEMKIIHSEAAIYQSRLAVWLAQNNPPAAWNVRLGSYTAGLSYAASLPNRIAIPDLTTPANSLLQNSPLGTPEAVQNNLRNLISFLNSPHPESPAGFVTVLPKNATEQQLSQAYKSLLKLYSAPAP